ncbi:uroporphyrinogen-III C-methyltransferase [Salvia divinorum]|uniref:Uroporphyrinogen-III C-methyltransferase n=1 Tax=Salvia divinorum TaxID=28513 RepID=A0ABD1GTL8_SALDI
MDFLQQGIEVKVIPGMTAASGIDTELGIPLTHRGVAISVRFLTGHSRKRGTDPVFVAENATDPDSTFVVYMGLVDSPFPRLQTNASWSVRRHTCCSNQARNYSDCRYKWNQNYLFILFILVIIQSVAIIRSLLN